MQVFELHCALCGECIGIRNIIKYSSFVHSTFWYWADINWKTVFVLKNGFSVPVFFPMISTLEYKLNIDFAYSVPFVCFFVAVAYD